jgi:hypothetical protein
MKYEYKGYIIQESQRNGGKAGKGKNKTTSLIITGPALPDSIVPFFKYVPYKIGAEGRAKALNKSYHIINLRILESVKIHAQQAQRICDLITIKPFT